MVHTDIYASQLLGRTLSLPPIHRNLLAIGGLVHLSAMENQVYSPKPMSKLSSQVCPISSTSWSVLLRGFVVKAKALYSYVAGGSDELPFAEGDELTIIDTSEEEWWKTEQGGVVFIVPAAYLEAVEG